MPNHRRAAASEAYRHHRARGANFVEYLIIVGVIALAAIVGFQAFGKSSSGLASTQGECVEAMGCRGGGNFPSSTLTGGEAGGGSSSSEPSFWQRGLDAGWQSIKTTAGYYVSINKGVFVDGVWGTVKGVGVFAWNLTTDPVGTTVAIGEGAKFAVENPGQVWHAIKTDIVKSWNEDPVRTIGNGAFQIVSSVVPVSKVGLLGKGANVADKAADAARAAEKAAEAASPSTLGKIAKAEEAAKTAQVEQRLREAIAAERAAEAAKRAATPPHPLFGKFLGEGTYCETYLKGDTVTKILKDKLTTYSGGTYAALTAADKKAVAEAMTTHTNTLSAAFGSRKLPPVRDLDNGVLEQKYVEGLEFDDLHGDAKRLADQQVGAHTRAAQQILDREAGPNPRLANGWTVQVDRSEYNFRFNEKGEVVGWFDPIMVNPP